jgi:hypothetical protein
MTGCSTDVLDWSGPVPGWHRSYAQIIPSARAAPLELATSLLFAKHGIGFARSACGACSAHRSSDHQRASTDARTGVDHCAISPAVCEVAAAYRAWASAQLTMFHQAVT